MASPLCPPSPQLRPKSLSVISDMLALPDTAIHQTTPKMAGRRMPRIMTELPADRPRKFGVPIDLGGLEGPAMLEYTNTESVTNVAFRFCMDHGISINFVQKIGEAIMEFCGKGNYPNYGFDTVSFAEPTHEESELRAQVDHLYEQLANVRSKLADQEAENQKLRGVSSQGFPSTVSQGTGERFTITSRPVGEDQGLRDMSSQRYPSTVSQDPTGEQFTVTLRPVEEEQKDWRLRDSGIAET